MPDNAPFRLAVAGLGTVGSATCYRLQHMADMLATRAGRPLELSAVSARDATKERGFALSRTRWVQDPLALAHDPALACVVELIGGTDGVALELTRTALINGKHVVTANKAMLAVHGAELAALADAHGVCIAYEAAVAGGIPIVKTMRETLAGNRMRKVTGILNGTCNFILTEMSRSGAAFDGVLAQAQENGYAEADPTFDIDGIDAAHKLALLAALAFGCPPDFASVRTEGVRHVSATDIAFAEELGYAIKLLGIASMSEHGLEQRVQPCLVPKTLPIARVDGVFNAIAVEADAVGALMLEGPGAGGDATASAVLSDVVDLARGHVLPAFAIPAAALAPLPAAAPEHHVGPFYVRMEVRDQPGVLADIAACLRDHGISIESLLQRGRNPYQAVPIVMTLHETDEASLLAALARIEALPIVLQPPRMLRIEKA